MLETAFKALSDWSRLCSRLRYRTVLISSGILERNSTELMFLQSSYKYSWLIDYICSTISSMSSASFIKSLTYIFFGVKYLGSCITVYRIRQLSHSACKPWRNRTHCIRRATQQALRTSLHITQLQRWHLCPQWHYLIPNSNWTSCHNHTRNNFKAVKMYWISTLKNKSVSLKSI